jgi:hypothetical protein
MTEPGSPTSSEIVFYQGEDGRSRIQVRLDGGTVWLTQRLLAELYQVSVPTINEHLTNIFGEDELDPGATIRKFRIVQTEGTREVSRLVDHYDLDVILAVGYRVRSHRGACSPRESVRCAVPTFLPCRRCPGPRSSSRVEALSRGA